MRALSCVVACIPALLPFAAEAQESPIADSSLEASFDGGVRAFEAGDFEEALTLFTRALDHVDPGVVRREEIRLNVALCLEHLGRYGEASTLYDALARSDLLDVQRREIARRSAVQARSRLGVLVVEGTPEGAQVLVDGEPLCELPCEARVDPGRHEVVIRAEVGEASGSVEVEPGAVGRIRLAVRAARAEGDPARSEPARAASLRATALTWAGLSVLAVGGAGIIGFGLTAQRLHDDYLRAPSVEIRDRGLLMRDLANASIGIVALGAALVIADLVVGLLRRRAGSRPAGRITASRDGRGAPSGGSGPCWLFWQLP